MTTVVERDPQLEPSAAPVGHHAAAVSIKERPAWIADGFLGLLVAIAAAGLGTWAFIAMEAREIPWLWFPGVVGYLVFALIVGALTVVPPGQTRVIQFFGRYVGTVRKQGFIWLLPLTSRQTASIRVRNFETSRMKVNDAVGNPVEIAAIIVWQVADTAKATFAVEDYDEFIHVQSEAAVRHVAGAYPYDGPDDADSLRGSTDQISLELAHEVAARASVAGLEILEVRISHLAYAPEIAQAMLQRQQAAAVVAARSRIVEGAVGMVQMALDQLNREGIVELDEERKAAMVSNLLVVLCGDSRATPVVNTGTLYQ